MTIYDIAKALNISSSTVSRALNNNPRISKKTRILIQETAKKMGYQQNRVAQALRKGDTKTVGVIVPYVDRAFFGAVLDGVEEVLNSEGYHTILCQSHDQNEDEVSNIETLLSAQVSGILISVAPGENYDHLQKVVNMNIPLVMFDRIVDDIATSTVKVDDFQGAYSAVTHLIETGCSRIAHFHGNMNLKIYHERYLGYRKALYEHGIPFDESLVLEGDCFIQEGIRVTEKLIKSNQAFDSIFCSSDYKAIGAIKKLREEGYRVPEDISIIGFSNEPLTDIFDPSISSVDQLPKDMGKRAAELFISLCTSGNDTSRQVKEVLTPELKIRESSLKSKDLLVSV